MDTRTQELFENFSFLEDWQEKYRYMIDLGRALPPMDEALKTEESRVHGCTSRVWMVSQVLEDGNLLFLVDSDAHIVRGLLAILVQLVSNRSAEQILALDLSEVLSQLELAEHLSPSRSNGLFSMVKRIREIAQAHVQSTHSNPAK